MSSATLDVPRELLRFIAKLLAAARRRRGTRKQTRAPTRFGQAVLALRWFRHRTDPATLAVAATSPAPPPPAPGTR